MSRREDSLSLELYITLACLTGIVGIVLLATGLFPADVPLEMRGLRVLTGLLLLVACQRATRETLRRLRAPRTATLSLSDPDRLNEHVLGLLRAGRKIGAIRLYRDVTGVGLAEAKRQVEALQRKDQERSGRA